MYLDIKISYLTVIFRELFFAITFTLYMDPYNQDKT
jgi:hypothetical protein